MQVILLEDIQKLGILGDTVKVKPGFARNFLIPKGRAVVATPANVTAFEARRADLERQRDEVVSAAQGRAKGLDGLTIRVVHKAGGGGKLFGSVGAAELAQAITEAAGQEVVRSEVRLPGGDAIRQVGEYPITVHLHASVEATVTLQLMAEGAALDEEDEDLDEVVEEDVGEE